MIAPGQSETVAWEVKTEKRSAGKFIKKFTVTTNDRDNARVLLESLTTIKTALRTDPERLSFDRVKRVSGEQRKTVRITRGDGGPITPEVVSTGNPLIGTELREIKAGESYELDVTISPPWPNETMRGSIVITTGVAEIERQEVAVYVPIERRVRTNPPRFLLPPEGNESQAQEIILHFVWSGEKPPGKITEAVVSNSELAISIEEQAAEEVVVLKVPAGFKMRRGERCSVTIRTDDPGAPVLQVPVWAGGGRSTPVGRTGLQRTPPPAGSATGANTGARPPKQP